jgi:hypothetical protein
MDNKIIEAQMQQLGLVGQNIVDLNQQQMLAKNTLGSTRNTQGSTRNTQYISSSYSNQILVNPNQSFLRCRWCFALCLRVIP